MMNWIMYFPQLIYISIIDCNCFNLPRNPNKCVPRNTRRMLDDGNNMRPIDVSVSDNDVETEPCADEMEEFSR